LLEEQAGKAWERSNNAMLLWISVTILTPKLQGCCYHVVCSRGGISPKLFLQVNICEKGNEEQITLNYRRVWCDVDRTRGFLGNGTEFC